MNKDAIDYVEQQAAKNIGYHDQCGDCLTEEANKVLSLLGLLIPGALAGAVKLFEMQLGSPRPAGTLVLALATGLLACYLAVLAAYVTLACLRAGDAQPPTNQPMPLIEALQRSPLEAVRHGELMNLDARIESAAARNRRRGKHLNRVRLLFCATPLAYLLFWVLALFLV